MKGPLSISAISIKEPLRQFKDGYWPKLLISKGPSCQIVSKRIYIPTDKRDTIIMEPQIKPWHTMNLSPLLGDKIEQELIQSKKIQHT
jgi:hypothetical protein